MIWGSENLLLFIIAKIKKIILLIVAVFGEAYRISITSDNRISLHFSLINVQGAGYYPIEDAASSIIPPIPYNMYSKTYIYLEKVEDDDTHFYFSIENTGSIEIIEYNEEDGILVGTFSCDLYSSANPDVVKPISGEFNINLSTLDINKKPCWM